MQRYLIVNADDLGLSHGTNLAIERAFRDGIVTSASLMANMPALEHAIDHVLRRNPDLGIGLHLCLTSGRPVLPPGELPLLVDDQGMFRHSTLGLLRLMTMRGAAVAQAARELEAQALRLDACGVAIDHINGHQHAHILPAIFPIVVRLARQRNAAVRLPLTARLRPRPPRIGRLRSWLGGGTLRALVVSTLARRACQLGEMFVAADHCLGVAESGSMTLPALRGMLEELPSGVSEIFLHPGCADLADPTTVCSPLDQRFLRSVRRSVELEAVLTPGLRETLAAQGVVLTSFRELRREQLSHTGSTGPLRTHGRRAVA